jgi:hypothetical protein
VPLCLKNAVFGHFARGLKWQYYDVLKLTSQHSCGLEGQGTP